MTRVSLSQIDNWSHVALPFILMAVITVIAVIDLFLMAVIAVIAVIDLFLMAVIAVLASFYRRRTLVRHHGGT